MDWDRILKHYDLPENTVVSHIGGTAAPNVLIKTPHTDYVLRRRPPGMCRREHIEFDHNLRTYLADMGFVCPPLVKNADGETWTVIEHEVYEMSIKLPGRPAPMPDETQLYQAGTTLARFHSLTHGFQHPGKNDFVREDHISVLQPLLDRLFHLKSASDEKKQLQKIQRKLDKLSDQLDGGVYHSLERSIIHGDFHPGNVLYDQAHVSALLDYDYAAPGAVLRDVVDGIMFFAATRPNSFDPDDIWSLTQPWQPDANRSRIFLHGYASVRSLPQDWTAAVPLMMSRWLQAKLRGSRKVADHHKIEFVLKGIWHPLSWLENEASSWLEQLKTALHLNTSSTYPNHQI